MTIVETNGCAVKSDAQWETNIDLLLAQLSGMSGGIDGQYSAYCPAHDDNRASLSIREDDNERALVNCHAGCTREEIFAAVGMSSGAAKYDYRDETGNVLFQVVRQTGKRFFQRRPDGSGGWIDGTKGVRCVVYRLPELLAADPTETIFICEGEKDADALADLGLVATCNPGGAGKWRSEFADVLRGRPVVILPDNDPPGEKHAENVAQSVHGVASSVKVVALPGLPPGGDVSDFLDGGKAEFDLLAAVDAVAPWKPTSKPARWLLKMSDIKLRNLDWLWQNRIPLRKLTMLVGNPGLGKSLVSLDIAARVDARLSVQVQAIKTAIFATVAKMKGEVAKMALLTDVYAGRVPRARFTRGLAAGLPGELQDDRHDTNGSNGRH